MLLFNINLHFIVYFCNRGIYLILTNIYVPDLYKKFLAVQYKRARRGCRRSDGPGRAIKRALIKIMACFIPGRYCRGNFRTRARIFLCAVKYPCFYVSFCGYYCLVLFCAGELYRALPQPIRRLGYMTVPLLVICAGAVLKIIFHPL